MPLPTDVEDDVFLDTGSYPYRITDQVVTYEDWVFLDDGQVQFSNVSAGGERVCAILLLGAGT